jgi:hypothetical protein
MLIELLNYIRTQSMIILLIPYNYRKHISLSQMLLDSNNVESVSFREKNHVRYRGA